MVRSRSTKIALEGKKIGRFTVLHPSVRVSGECRWVCRCVCGKRIEALERNLTDDRSGYCLCLPSGMAELPEYGVWRGMIARCGSPRDKDWQRYGGRGIRVCDRWRAFDHFFEDMGPRPSAEHSIDRIDNDGNYEPGNCRWATSATQQNNRCDNRMIEYSGMRMSVAAWAELTGLSAVGITARLDGGCCVEEVLQAEAKARERLMATKQSRQ